MQPSNKFTAELLARIPYSKNIIDNIGKLNPKYDVFDELTQRKIERIAAQSVVYGTTGTTQHSLQSQQGGIGQILQNNSFAQYMYANADANDKVRRLQDYRKMASYSELSDAVDEICDECIVYNTEDNSVVQFDVLGEHDRDTKDELNKEWKNFVQYFQLEDKGWEYFRQFLIDGELFFENVISQNRPDYGTLGVMAIPSELITPIYDNVQNDIIKGFMLRKPIKGQDEHQRTIEKEQLVLMEPQQVTYINSGIWNADRTVRLPYIEAARRPYKQLSLIEDAIIIYRLVRAPERLVFNVEVGNMNVPQSEAYLKKLMHQYWSKQTFDFAGKGGVQNSYNPQSMLDAFWFPKRNGQASTEVTSLAGGCLAMDTEIPLLDGRILTISQMADEYENGKVNWIYSCNPETGEIVPGKVDWAGVTHKSAKVLRLTLDNGKSITCTPDHKFPTINRGKCRADELSVDDSIYAFNRKLDKLPRAKNNSTYEYVYQHHSKSWEITHRLVVRFLDKFPVIRNKIYNEAYVDDRGNFDTIHHCDINRYNNSPENLVWMNFKDHYKMHGEMSNPVVSRLISKGLRRYISNLSDDERDARADRSRSNFRKGTDVFLEKLKDPIFKIKHYAKVSKSLKKTCNTPEYRESMSKRSIELWSDADHRSNMIQSNYDRWSDDEYRDRVCNSMRLVYSEESLRNLISMINSCGEVHLRHLVTYLNDNPDNIFTKHFLLENDDKKGWSGVISETTLKSLVKANGYRTYTEFRSEMKLFNHRIVNIEYLDDDIEVGTLTIDKDEKYHNYHTFATCSGIMTYNSNLGQLDDLIFFQKKLYKSLKIPLSRMDPSNVYSDGITITREELKFASFVMRIQRNFAMGIKNSFITHLKLRKMWTDYDLKESDLNIKFNTPTSFGVMREQQVFAIKLENFNSLANNEMVSTSFAQRYYLGWSDNQISENRQWMRKDSEFAWEMEQIRTNGPDFANTQDAMQQAEADIAGGGGAGGAGGSAFSPDIPPDFGPAPAGAPEEVQAGETTAPAGQAPTGQATPPPPQ